MFAPAQRRGSPSGGQPHLSRQRGYVSQTRQDAAPAPFVIHARHPFVSRYFVIPAPMERQMMHFGNVAPPDLSPNVYVNVSSRLYEAAPQPTAGHGLRPRIPRVTRVTMEMARWPVVCCRQFAALRSKPAFIQEERIWTHLIFKS